MWRAYWANPLSKNASHLTADDRIRLLKRSTAPLLDFRCQRWAPQTQIAKELDRHQVKMIASLLRLPYLEGERPEDYVRRRGRLAARLAQSHGPWSRRWFQRVLSWDEHLARPRNRHLWAAKLRSYHDRDWFIFRRSMFAPSVASRHSPASATAGRTDTRSGQAKVHMRWHDGIEYARGH